YFSPKRYYLCKNGRMIFGKRSSSKGKALEYLLKREGEYVAEEQLREVLGIMSIKNCLYALRIQMSFSSHYRLVMENGQSKRYKIEVRASKEL
ncbi:MAG: hypothetical protein AABX65_00265, partial [Nanoarchaeota archaeon]